MVTEINLPVPPGFRGLREDLPVTIYTRHLPHWRQEGATYFVTFCQADAHSDSKHYELASLRAEWERRHPVPRSNAAWDELFRAMWNLEEESLDQSHGSCRLGNPDCAGIVVDTMHHFDGQRYQLNCYVVMSNHVHAVLKPLDPAIESLEKILQTWKRYSAQRINELCDDTGTFWQQESFDRIVRDEEHLYRCLQYIGRNPRKCGRTPESCQLWLREDWQELGWRFEEDIHQRRS